MSDFSWRKSLITKEDPWHVHKTLGTLCLASFCYRFSQDNDMGFRSKPKLTVPTILLHLCLNLSSFEFRVPQRRISSGYRIWSEYRAHSLVFLIRSLASMLVTWYEETHNLPPNYWCSFGIVMASMASADGASKLCGYSSGFARDLQTSNYVKFLFSFMQFAASSACLYGVREYSTQFVFVLIIQCNAFLMTLRRKNLASQKMLVAIYGGMLAGGYGFLSIRYQMEEDGEPKKGSREPAVFFLTSYAATIIRLGPKLPGVLALLQNKFVMWTYLFFLQQSLRGEDREADAGAPLLCITGLGLFAMLSLGYHKCRYGYSADSQKSGTRKDTS